MAIRKVFVPNSRSEKYVREYEVEFKWSQGKLIENTRESIKRMHFEAQRRYKLENLCEISGASIMPLGRLLSAFQLPVEINSELSPVECVYQGSKVFENGGPYQDLYHVDPRQAKKDPRLKKSGKLINFKLNDIEYSSEPKNAFYDILYIGALQKFIKDSNISNHRFLKHFGESGGFTDIYFNPVKSINCQARSVLYSSRYKNEV